MDADHKLLSSKAVEGVPWQRIWECTCGATGVATRRVLGESWHRSVMHNFRGHVRRATTGARR